MAFVNSYEYDIFVSYAQVDDKPVPGEDGGWVTTLVKGLKTRLAQKLGRDDSYSLWMDFQLPGNVSITPEIMNSLERTATLLVILSPGYMASEWCQREREAFLNMVQERVRSGSRVFVIERDEVDEPPPEFADLIGYRFWVADREGKPSRILGIPQPEDKRYHDLLNDLSNDLTRELKRLKEIDRPDNRIAVLLAEVTDDLDLRRDEVKRYLDQAGLRVLPETCYPRDPSAFRKALDEDIKRSVLFVQLLSGITGKKSPDLPKGYVGLQYDNAVESEKNILQWRSRELDLKSITDESYRELVDGNTVLAVSLEEFKRRIVEQAFSEAEKDKEGKEGTDQEHLDAFIFVDTGTEDRDQANAVCKVLDEYGAGYALPMRIGKPSEIREDLESNLLECDVLIIIYGKVAVKWVRSRVLQCHKIHYRRERPLSAFAIYAGPPGPKDPLDLKLPNMQIIDCCMSFNSGKLKSFLDNIKLRRI